VFRSAGTADALCISVLATQVFLDTYAIDGIRPSLAREVLEHLSVEAFTAHLSQPDARFIVAERAAHLIAFAQLTLGRPLSGDPARPAANLNRLYVHERFTGTGLGTALLGRAETLAAAEGCAVLWLTSWTGNTRALAFYGRRGYKDVGSSTYSSEGEHYENRVLVRELDPRGETRLPGQGSNQPEGRPR
jgi:GNAT superfamily N-acetyltransferase